MKFVPKNVKFYKVHKIKKSVQHKVRPYQQGFFCRIVSLDYIQIEYLHIELIRRFLAKKLKKQGVLVCTISLTQPSTKKPQQSRMGKGAGKFDKWYTFLEPGKTLFEIKLKDLSLSYKILSSIVELNKKLFFRCFLIFQNYFLELNKKNFLFMNNIKISKHYIFCKKKKFLSLQVN